MSPVSSTASEALTYYADSNPAAPRPSAKPATSGRYAGPGPTLFRLTTLPSMLTRATAIVAMAALSAGAGSAQAAVCTNLAPPGSVGVPSGIASVSAFAFMFMPPAIASAETRGCEGVAINGDALGRNFSAAAQARPGTLRARASSNDGTSVSSFARSVLNFKVRAKTGQLGERVQLSFHVDADGIYGGPSLPFAGGGAFRMSATATGFSGSTQNIERMSDTNGVVRNDAKNENIGQRALVTATIDYTDTFALGESFFQLDLFAFANPSSFADFSNTALVSSITLGSSGFELDLPDGIYTADPTAPGRYLLAREGVVSAVPEPSTSALLIAGVAMLAVLGRRRAKQS